MTKFKELMTDINAKHDQVKSIFDKADDEKRENTKEEIADVKKINKEIETLELKATELKEGEELRSENERKRAEAIKNARMPIGGAAPPEKGDMVFRGDPRYAEARKSLGDVVTEDEQFKAWLKGIAPGGRIPERTNIQSPPVQVKALVTGGSDTSGGALVHTEYYATVNTAPFKPLTLEDLISKGTTGSDLVEYVRITGYTNNAAMVPEATATGDGSGAKPESGMDLVKVQEAVKTIAHWIAATNRALADAAQMRTLINTFLLFGLQDIKEAQMLLGDGTGENFLGIFNTPGIQTQAFVTDIIVTTRKARTKCKTPGRVNPNGYLMSPLDWETFDLLKDAENRYYWGGPSMLGQPRLWGLPVIENENITAGRALCADFRYAMLWDREQASISVSNSHADFFVRNMIAILAELRAAFGVLYPKAFVDIDLTA